MENQSNDLLKNVVEPAMKALDLSPEYDDEFRQLRAVVVEHQGRALLGCTARLDLERALLITTAMISQAVPDDALGEVVEFVTRLNYSLSYGAFDVDIDEGWVQFRTGVCYRGTELTERLVGATLSEAIDAFRLYLDDLVAVIEGELDAIAAWQRAIGES